MHAITCEECRKSVVSCNPDEVPAELMDSVLHHMLTCSECDRLITTLDKLADVAGVPEPDPAQVRATAQGFVARQHAARN